MLSPLGFFDCQTVHVIAADDLTSGVGAAELAITVELSTVRAGCDRLRLQSRDVAR
jgi:hypothetical protein